PDRPGRPVLPRRGIPSAIPQEARARQLFNPHVRKPIMDRESRRLRHPTALAWPLLFWGACSAIIPGRADDRGPAPQAAADWPLAYQDDFERDEPSGWDFTDKSAWRITHVDERHRRVLEQFRQSQYQPAVRSPLNIALVQGHDVADFVLDVDVRSTG